MPDRYLGTRLRSELQTIITTPIMEKNILYISHRELMDQFEACFVPEFQKSEA